MKSPAVQARGAAQRAMKPGSNAGNTNAPICASICAATIAFV
jgi:hypothetical protein